MTTNYQLIPTNHLPIKAWTQGVPFEAEATFVTEPLSRSSWLIVYEDVQVIDPPGSSKAVGGQNSFVVLSSETVNGPNRVVLPVFVTTYE